MEINALDFKIIFYQSLNERQRRQFAALEANQLGHGGIKAVCSAFKIDPVTVRRGIIELSKAEVLPNNRIRKNGGGRKSKQSSLE